MAELVVRTKTKSSLRNVLDRGLSGTFPLWGIVAPFLALVCIGGVVSYTQQHDPVRVWEFIYFVLALMSFSVCSLLLKRLASYDSLIVDKQGIKLPVIMGTGLTFNSFIAWKSVDSVKAIVSSSDIGKSYITINRKKGRPVKISLNQLEPDFVEQLLLATQMWSPSSYHPSLESLQSALRAEARVGSTASHTDLWEEELGRRFAPTNYVPLETGKVLRNSTLQVVRQLASGGLSALYLCQVDGKQLVVLKEAMIPKLASESVQQKAKELFERESRLLMRVEHSSIVRILDCFTEGERNYMLLEYVNGIDLHQMVQQNGPQKESEVLEWAVQIALAIKYLHEREEPIIHRDLTPDNIVLRNDGKIVIVDFGAANELIGNATGTFVGKHAFIAPEQLRGKATAQSDIYAFGCTVFYLLTGAEPEALSQSSPRALNEFISEELSELVETCTQLECSERYQTIAQLLPVLRRLAAQTKVS
ncbi:MAG: serine/threonine protein kinase [Candidatus Obscuribacterales bacterium]|nr:serine/threonine protein kinase [Candidatus Obscuribacterales bacterium]